jgi:group II intron maturase/DegT/DnrJ/EryC1/StrS aminotransferase family protein
MPEPRAVGCTLINQACEQTGHYRHGEVGFNYRMSNLHAAAGVAQLERLEVLVDAKRAIHARYAVARNHRAGLRFVAVRRWQRHSYEVDAVLAPMGLGLSADKTRVCHIDEGFDFLGWHIQRRAWRSRSGKRAVYTYPSKKALASIMDKVRTLTRRKNHRTLADLLRRLNPVLRGWCNYHVESRMRRRVARPVRRAARRNPPVERPAGRCGPTQWRPLAPWPSERVPGHAPSIEAARPVYIKGFGTAVPGVTGCHLWGTGSRIAVK